MKIIRPHLALIHKDSTVCPVRFLELNHYAACKLCIPLFREVDDGPRYYPCLILEGDQGKCRSGYNVMSYVFNSILMEDILM